MPMGVVAPVVALALGDCFYPCIGHPTVNMARMSYTPRGTLSRHGHPLTALGQRGICIEGTPSMRSFYLVGLRCRPARWIGEPLYGSGSSLKRRNPDNRLHLLRGPLCCSWCRHSPAQNVSINTMQPCSGANLIHRDRHPQGLPKINAHPQQRRGHFCE